MIKLNLGCGLRILEGYTNIDIIKTHDKVLVADIRKIQYAEGTVDEIYLRHVIEHFYEDEIIILLKRFYNMLKPKAKLIIETVDFDLIMEGWKECKMEKELLNKFLFGFYAYENMRERDSKMLHKYVFDKDLLTKFLLDTGFSRVIFVDPPYPFNYNPKYGDFFTAMRAEAIK